MKVSLLGITGVPLGKHNVKDPRLDQVDDLIEERLYAQVDVVGEDEAVTSDAIVVSPGSRLDLILARSGIRRNPSRP